jgi:hypothetical protein
MARRLLAVGLSVLVLSSCGGGDDGAEDTASPTAEVRPGLEEDKAAAQAALLTLADFPSGWSEVPAEDEPDDEDVNRQMAACVGSEGDSLIEVGGAEASTGDFSDPEENVTISEDVGIAATEDEAAAALTALDEPGVTACFQDVFRGFISDLIENPETPEDSLPEGASVGEVTFGRLNVAPVGDQVVAYRVTMPISIDSLSIDIYLDIVIARQGRSMANLLFESTFDPYPTEELDRIVALAVGRLPTE